MKYQGYEIVEVSNEEALDIIKTRKPSGLFIEKTKRGYVGIDNTTGDAFCEEFFKKDKCLAWLTRETI